MSAQVAGRKFVAAKTTVDLALDTDALIAAITPRTRLILLGSPNNPTGSVVSDAEARRVLAAMPADCLLVLDEAYFEYAQAWPEFSRADGLALLRSDPRVVVLRTFSKIYGLAGLRVGYAIAAPGVIELLGRVTRTFHVGTLAQAAALAALGDTEFVARSQAVARQAVEAYRDQLQLAGSTVYRSAANFVLVNLGRPAEPIYQALLKKGVIVRPMAAWGLPTCIRISAALPSDVLRVIAAVHDVVGS
ncbi:MAG: aminotransferase class I/II-fold pyridoxal phosphate-dependent enzyme [Myxococcales bacterium]|nr:aminotransferase class I/II-fold pyridoxal phosphate-dependent enzyme [Myxococcales bacterium]